MDPLSELQDDLTLDDTSEALNQLKLASIDEKNWPSDEMPDFSKSERSASPLACPLTLLCSSDDSKSSSPEPVTHLKWDDPYYDIARHQIVEVADCDEPEGAQPGTAGGVPGESLKRPVSPSKEHW
ncbi:Rho GTPase-activating protein 1 [Saguinus oedipus]|uniref:Rho GTPase-activating protein 1 n=1 Tax=Saguinus oedipus TaxID=9490 RepID=A0ABQ9UUP2_SAGOE|nr:Rho GTPase-activating protein 1 [Saguinus oedipus]